MRALHLGFHFVAAVLLLGVVALAPEPASAAVFYVDPEHPRASDGHPGTDPGRPWASIDHATLTAGPGDEVRIAANLPPLEGPLRPRRNGLPEAPVVFRSESDTARVKLVTGQFGTCIYLKGVSHVVVRGIDCESQPAGSDPTSWVEFRHASDNTVANSVFRGALTGDGVVFDAGSRRNRFVDNLLAPEHIPSHRETIHLLADATHNLIQGNDVRDGGHNAIQIRSSFNVIRNNRFTSRSYRAVAFTPDIDSSDPNRWNVFEQNRVQGSGSRTQAAQHWSSHTIIRQNYFIGNDGSGLKITRPPDGDRAPDVSRNRIYSNLFLRNGTEPSTWRGGAGLEIYVRGFASSSADNRVLNNVLLMNNVDSAHQIRIQFADGKLHGTDVRHNMIGTSLAQESLLLDTGLRDIRSAEAELPGLLAGNFAADPAFCDPQSDDYSPKPGSPLIDRGTHLTHVVVPSGRQELSELILEDTDFFTDGNGIVPGDVIQLAGSGERRRILRIERGEDLVELNAPVDVRDGEGVSLAWEGAAPDVGPVEAGTSATCSLGAPSAPRIVSPAL